MSLENVHIGWICMYWIPLAVCVVGYTGRTVKNIRRDLRVKKDFRSGDITFYQHTDTMSDVIGRVFFAIVPCINIWAALFDISPTVCRKITKFVDKVFNSPLVP